MIRTERAIIKDTKKENTREPTGNQAKEPWSSAECSSRYTGTNAANTAANSEDQPAKSTACCGIQGVCASEYCRTCLGSIPAKC